MKKTKGFTMIELLIVIAVLGILAVAVLAAINPIEQINRGRDTGGRSDAEQLISGIDRYYATKGQYPWMNDPHDSQAMAFTAINSLDAVLSNLVTETGELKESFRNRLTGADYNTLYIYNGGDQGDSTYACFVPKSEAFLDDAEERCEITLYPDDFDAECDAGGGNYYSCLP